MVTSDLNVWIHKDPNKSNAERVREYREHIVAFSNTTNEYRSVNGVNVILQTSGGAVQVDLILAYHEHADWTRVLAPEYRIKGVITTSIASSMAKVLNLSFGPYGIQAKLQDDGSLTPFTQRKGAAETRTVTSNPKTWGQDIYKFFYEMQHGESPTSIPRALEEHPGMGDEQRGQDLINVITALARAFEENGMFGKGGLKTLSSGKEMIDKIRKEFDDKVDKATKASKYEKATTPEQKAKADKTKKQLRQWGDQFLKALDASSASFNVREGFKHFIQ